MVNGWLTSGAISKLNNFEITETGLPQGGIISPHLANFTLEGLEKHIRSSINSITGGKDFRKNIYQDSVRVKMLSFSIKTVRYADDFIVIANSENLIVKFIRPAIVSFLAERGLELSTEKTKTFCIASGKELCFLGYVFKYRDNWKLKYSFFKDRIGGPGIAMYPDKSKVNEIIKKLKEVFIKSTNQTAYELISIVNPIIRGWSNYFNMGESSTFRGYLRYALYLMVWDWAHRKHPKWGRINIAKTYFLDENLNVEHSGNGNLWTFRGITRTNSRYSNMEEGKVRFMLRP